MVSVAARASEFRQSFAIPIGGDENTSAAVALVDDTLYVGRTGTRSVERRDATDGALRGTLDCPVAPGDEPGLDDCGFALAGSRRVVAVSRWDGAWLFHPDGTLIRRIVVDGTVTDLAVRGDRVLVAGQAMSPTFQLGAVRAQLFDATSGRLLRTYVVPHTSGVPRHARVAIGGRTVFVSAFSATVVGDGAIGSVTAFDGRTEEVQWQHGEHRLWFGRALAVLRRDVVASAGGMRLDGRTGVVEAMYADSNGVAPWQPVGAAGRLIAVPRTVQSGEDTVGRITVLDAATAAPLYDITIDQPMYEVFGLRLLMNAKHLVVTTGNYIPDGYVFGFTR